MKLMYLSQEAINDIKINYKKYKAHFNDNTNEWFMNLFEKNDWIHESKIECVELELNYDPDFSISDKENIKIVYEALKDLSPSVATDERLWAGVLFGQLWKYVKYRRAAELVSGEERDVLNSFFFLRGTKRSCFMNCLSRLWWTGHLYYDKDKSNHYEAIDMICESAYASNIILLSSNNFMANKELGLGVLDSISEKKKNGNIIKRDHYVKANKYLNSVGGITLLDTLSRKDAKELIDRYLEKEFSMEKTS